MRIVAKLRGDEGARVIHESARLPVDVLRFVQKSRFNPCVALSAWVARRPNSDRNRRADEPPLPRECNIPILLKHKLRELIESDEMVGPALVVFAIPQVLAVAEMELGPAWEFPPGGFAVDRVRSGSLACEPFVRDVEQAFGNRELGKRASQNQRAVAWEVDELQSSRKQEHRFPAAGCAPEKQLAFPIHREPERLTVGRLDR